MFTVGIDLGTTASVVATVRNGKTDVISIDYSKNTLPSVVNYSENPPLVGRAALQTSDLSKTVFSIKRFMGTDEEFFGKSAAEISGDILFHLKKIAEQAAGEKIDAAVITVPAHFSNQQRMETKHAASLAGIKILQLINEPTAAAIAFGLDERKEGIFGVYDFGGGTFDFSVLRLVDGVFQVLATGGNNYLGGDDIDIAICNHNLEQLGIKKDDLNHSEKILCQYIAKSLKESLGTQTRISEKFMLREREITFSLSSEELQKFSQPFIRKTLAIADQVFKDSKIPAKKIDEIVLVGGMTKLSLVKNSVREHFDCNVLDSINPDEAVARGAALQAHNIVTKNHNMLLIDVVPLTLGIETYGGGVDRIIHRNTPIPIIEKREYTTQVDNQTGMKFRIVQGENPAAKNCLQVATFELKGIPPMPAGRAKVIVDFSVDANGLLTVEASEKSTGQHQSITVEASGGISEKELLEILENALKNRKEYLIEEALIGQKVEAERQLKFWESMIDELPAEEQKSARDGIESLKKFLKENNYDEIVATKKAIEKIFEPFLDEIITRKMQGKRIRDIEQQL